MTTKIEIANLAGEAQTRGATYGSARRKQIHACLADWLQSLRTASIPDPQHYIAQMLRDTDFLTAIRAHTPDLLEEVNGIAAGAGESPDLLLAAQLMDEEWDYRPSFLRRGEALQKCSSAAIHFQKGLSWIGQNMDLGGYTDGHQIALRIARSSTEQGALIFTIGGMIGLMGVNARGVGVCVNSLPQLPAAREGLPVAFVIRKLLQSDSLSAAVDTVRAVPHATGQHYLLADSTGVRSFEASPDGVLEYKSPDPSRVLHTNHPLAEFKGVPYSAAAHANTEARLRSLTQRLMTGEPDLEAIKAALSSCDDPEHPVCRLQHPNAKRNELTGMIGFTTGSIVSTLEEQGPSVESWVSAGPPSLRGYTRIELPKIA